MFHFGYADGLDVPVAGAGERAGVMRAEPGARRTCAALVQKRFQGLDDQFLIRPLRLAEATVPDAEHAARTLHAMLGLTDREHFAALFLKRQSLKTQMGDPGLATRRHSDSQRVHQVRNGRWSRLSPAKSERVIFVPI